MKPTSAAIMLPTWVSVSKNPYAFKVTGRKIR